MAEFEVSVVDFGAGNLRSVVRALEWVGARVHLTERAEAIARSAALVLPGQGAARDAMANLRARGLVEPILAHIRAGKPYIGVCLGLQLLLERSDEHGGVDCLGVIPGTVRRFPPGPKIPQIGWNAVEWTWPHPAWEDVPSGAYFYFVHSYYAEPRDPAVIGGRTEYGISFASVLAQGNIVATQFHPEKSGDQGLRLYAGMLRWARRLAGAPVG